MKRGLITVAAALITLSTSAVGQAFAATGTVANETYVVHAGDTLYKIAASKNLSLSSVLAVNPQIQNVANILVGETIHLPLVPYLVQSGDTLYKIAVSQGVSLANLEKVNPQITNVASILPGQTMNIPINSLVEKTAATAGGSTATNITTAASTVNSSASNTSSSIATAPSSTSSSGASTESNIRETIVSKAKSYIGIPYAWGGQTPASGFDCSGFVEYVFGQNGITLPRESHDQATVGVPVAQSDLLPGDLLFFKDTDSSASLYPNHVTHVGIYMGNGAMIESSSSHNNEGVIIVQNVFSNPYYSAHYYGARDVIH